MVKSLVMMRLGNKLNLEHALEPHLWFLDIEMEIVRWVEQNIELLVDKNQIPKVERKVLSTTSIFNKSHRLDNSNQDVGPSFDWSVSHIEPGKRL